MEWTKEIQEQLTKLAFEEKSNKEIAQIMGVKVDDVYAGRSRFGITIDKVKAAKSKGVQAAVPRRTEKEIQEEISKVEQARREALKKVDRCLARQAELYKELQEARHESESTK